jgi:hypothetical protein
VQRVTGDRFYRYWNSSTIIYQGPPFHRGISYAEWVGAGSPNPEVIPPPNPGNSVNCSDFTYESQAQAWFDTYYPYYGDIAELDDDHDGKACEALP